MPIYNQDTLNQDVASNPYLGKSPEELDQIEKTLKTQLAQKRREQLMGAVNQGVQGVGDIFLQRGGITPPKREESVTDTINEFIAKERLKQQIASEAPKTAQEKMAEMELEEIERRRNESALIPTDTGIAPVSTDETTTPIVSAQTPMTSPTTKAPSPFIIQRERNKYGGYDEKSVDNPEYKTWEKEQEAKIKDKIGAEKGVSGTRNFVRSFSESRQELIDTGFENIGQATLGGFGERIGAGLVEKTGTLPKTTKFLNRLKVIANQSARDIEGGRVTDQDRQVYADAMANAIKFPDITNIGLAAEALGDLKNRGGNIEPVLNEFDNSGIDLFQSISAETRRLSSPISETGTQIIPPQAGNQKIGRFTVEVE